MQPNDILPPLKKRARIAVVYGGIARAGSTVINETVNGRGTKTYEAVAHYIAGSLRQLGFYEVELIPEDMHLASRLAERRIDLVWINSGGIQGMTPMSHAPASCELAGIPYVGHSPGSVALLDDKGLFKAKLRSLGIPTADYLVVNSAQAVSLAALSERFRGQDDAERFIVKPVSGRASLNVEVANRLSDVPDLIERVRAATGGGAVLVEEYLCGSEYAVSVDGPWVSQGGGQSITKLGRPHAFSAVQRVLDDGELIWTSMDKRAITGDRMRLTTGPIQAALVVLAEHVYRDCGLETCVRLDIRADWSGSLRVLECNPKPDLAPPTECSTSVICAGLPQAGMSYNDLILSILINRLDYLHTHRPALFSTLSKVFER
jgi:D-alanine-D-alanine ligase